MKKKQYATVILGEEVTDPDIKALYLIAEAMRISTPRMRKENLRFVLDSHKYKIEVL